MSYSCSDFTDSILDALGIEVSDDIADSPSDQADLALAEIARLQKIARAAGDVGVGRYPVELRPKAIAAAMTRLRLARQILRNSSAHRAAGYVARALKSVEGAHRHADRMARSAQPARKP